MGLTSRTNKATLAEMDLVGRIALRLKGFGYTWKTIGHWLERDVARVRYYTSLQLDALPPPANQTRWSIFGEYDRQHPILGIIDANGRKIVRIVATPDVALEEIRCALDMWVDVHNGVDATS